MLARGDEVWVAYYAALGGWCAIPGHVSTPGSDKMLVRLREPLHFPGGRRRRGGRRVRSHRSDCVFATKEEAERACALFTLSEANE